jgi:lipoprotein-anchoring transpeptidase ErfK/SrfK
MPAMARRALPGVLAGLALAACAGPAAAAPTPAPRQALVELETPHAVHAALRPGAATLMTVGARRPLTATPTTLPVLARARDAEGRPWLRVRLPGRRLTGRVPPATGWILAAGTRPLVTAWHLVVNLRARRVDAYRDGVRERRFGAVVGAPATPTPVGVAFVEENLRLPAARAGAPYALALSARSAVLQEFDGGPGQIALHGRRGVGGTLGTAASHGCVRLSDAAITWLAARIRPGVPVTVAR